VNREDEWEVEEVLVLEMDMRMVAEEESMGDEALVNHKMVTRRELTTLTWISKYSIGQDISPIQSFSLYLDSA